MELFSRSCLLEHRRGNYGGTFLVSGEENGDGGSLTARGIVEWHHIWAEPLSHLHLANKQAARCRLFKGLIATEQPRHVPLKISSQQNEGVFDVFYTLNDGFRFRQTQA
ncbi:hypothetical protein CYLTODRAFT_229642 [Cylindrobasidium torrendii FP15055 ss-10]|uniref:Uncharacterized protein n=1 Tax=Cylindrobasidium torrendii FP15055 ss-10 TaxID=1314674 RepID=A0A0D7AVD2_9AGAR|nr:hypothetical protein CYLTODRAFT_234766 [Cylindrobasidium torrendii FP15055 ss-10]KIY61321.1 hypothetical protein CYLTODRAFT_229642 [Cylindrobasidium torrendii FP15055 ss-10]